MSKTKSFIQTSKVNSPIQRIFRLFKLFFSKNILISPIALVAMLSNRQKKEQWLNFCKMFGHLKYSSDYLATSHNFNFEYDTEFLQAYELAKVALAQGGTPFMDLRWRVYNVCWTAYSVKHLEGDYVECGVMNACFSRAIISYITFENIEKKLYLLDTFEGTVEDQLEDKQTHYTYESTYENVKSYFSKYKNVEIIKGVIPETLSQVKSEKICYLSLDLNCSFPEIEALRYFWDKLVSGAMVIMDDYAYRSHETQMKAFDEFAQMAGVKILNLPCGQGLIIKP